MKVQNNVSPYKAVQSRGLSASLRRLATRHAVPMMAAGALLLAALPSSAATRTWTGNTTPNWNAVDGFDGVPVPGVLVNNVLTAVDSLVFNTAGNAGSILNNDFGTSPIFFSMTFNPGASSYTITNPKTYLSSPAYITSFTTGVTNNSGFLQVLNLDVGLQNGAVLAGSNFELAAGHNLISNQSGGSATISATNITLDAGSAVLAFNGRTLTQTATSTITAGTLSKGSNGTLILQGTNNYSGGTIITNGTLKLAGAGTMGVTTNSLTLTPDATTGGTNNVFLDLNGTSQTVDALTGSKSGSTTSTITNTNAATGTLTIGSAGGGGNYGGVITGAKTAIVKTGAGTETFSAAGNTYGGGTTVNGGTLALGSAAADGTGTLTVNTGGTVTVTANNALGAGQAKLAGGALRNATTSSTTQTTGQLSLLTSTASILDFGAVNSGATFTFSGFDATNTGTLSVMNWLGTPAVGAGLDQFFVSTTLTGNQLSQIKFNVGGVNLAAAQLGSGEIVAVAAPEPSQYAAFGLGLLGLGALALRARRRIVA